MMYEKIKILHINICNTYDMRNFYIDRQSNIEEPTRCNNNLLIYKISSTCFGQSFVHLQKRKTEIFTAYGILLLW